MRLATVLFWVCRGQRGSGHGSIGGVAMDLQEGVAMDLQEGVAMDLQEGVAMDLE